MNYIYGINAVTEALKARGRAFQWVGMAKERNDSMTWSAPNVGSILL